MSSLITLCYFTDIEERGSRGFDIDGKQLFAVKKSGEVYIYLNRCPHVGLPLHWQPDQFLNRDKELIQCSSHGALFQIETGRCVAGPCPGQSLKNIPFEIENGKIMIATAMLQ